MDSYLVTIKGRFLTDAVDAGHDDFTSRLAKRGGFELVGHAPMQQGQHTWLSASFDIQAVTPSAAVTAALRAFEEDSGPTVGTFDGVDLDG